MRDLSHYLLPGEKVLWSGTPARGLYLQSMDWFAIPFGLFWTGGVMFGARDVFTAEPIDPVAAFFMLVMLSVGLMVVVGRFFVDAYVRGHLDYAVTDQRILISRSGINGRFTALPLDRLLGVDLNLRGGGRGTIQFGPHPTLFNQWSPWVPSLNPHPQFINIADAKTVFALIQNTMPSRRLAA